MQVFGFRGDSKSPRYAIIEKIGGGYSFVNKDQEHYLEFPKTFSDNDILSKISWISDEFLNIFRRYPHIHGVVIKQNEYTQGDNKAKRIVSYEEAVLMSCCNQLKKPLLLKQYRALGTKSADVKEKALGLCCATNKYWDGKIADAIVAACWGIDFWSQS